MQRGVRIALCAALTMSALPAAGQTLQVAVSSPVTSIDPHYHNLAPNISLSDPDLQPADRNGRACPTGAGPRRILEAGRARHLGAQAARRQIPERQCFRRRRCGVHHGAHPQGAEQPEQLCRLHQAGDQHGHRRSTHHPPAHQWRVSAAADVSGAVLHHQPQVRRRPGDRGLQQRQGGDRHRAVPLRVVQAGRSRRAGTERQLLGTEAGLAEDHLPLHHERCLALGGAARWRCGFHRLRAHRGSGQAGQGSQGEIVGSARPAADLSRPRSFA